MKQLLSMLALGAALSFNAVAQPAAPAAGAAAPAASMPASPAVPAAAVAAMADKTPSPQQGRMVTCSKDAGDKKGDERKAFMKSCLSTAKVTQQTKMKTCNADAKTQALKGDARKSFMKTCLSNKTAA